MTRALRQVDPIKDLLKRVHQYFDGQFTKASDDKERYVVERARAISLAYIYHYADDGYVCRGIEVPFTLPVVDPDTSKPTGRWYGGIIDAILERQGRIWFCDHKTASKVDGGYWAELKTNSQLSRYLLAARQLGMSGVEGFLWDVIVKTSVQPKAITKDATKEINDTGSYCGIPVNEEVEWKQKETPRLYGVRVFAKYNDDTDKYFHRRLIRRSDTDLFEYAEELCEITEQIEKARKSKNRLIRNFGSCKQYGSLCEFHQVCSGETTIDDSLLYGPRTYGDEDRKRNAKGSNSESETNTYLSCPRRWQHRYQLRKQKVQQDYVEATNFGSMVHKAIEIWLKHRMERPIVLPNSIAV